MDFLRRFFNFSSARQDQHDSTFSDERGRNNFWSNRHHDDNFHQSRLDEDNFGTGFQIFSNPLEMHRYFEQQLNEVLKSFGMMGEESFLNDSFHFDVPTIMGPEEFQKSEKSLRDQYLKPGYQSTVQGNEKKVDADVDGKVNIDDLHEILKQEDKPISQFSNKPKINFFGQSVMTKTIRRPDGLIETHRTVRDGDGNEETTVTKKKGDQEYSVITRKNKYGEQETVENLVNLDENQVQGFLKGIEDKSVNKDQNRVDKMPPNWFPFDKFFK